MGRDEHKKSRGKRFLAQTPKQQISDETDIEFSEELVEQAYKEAREKRLKANERTNEDK